MKGIEMRLSFWPSEIIGAKAKCVTALVDPAELSKFCADPKSHCPMGCFSCPFAQKECKNITEEDWYNYFQIETPIVENISEKCGKVPTEKSAEVAESGSAVENASEKGDGA